MSQSQIKLSAAAYQQHTKLAGSINSQINKNGGVLSFAEFMQSALYAPGLGYYQSGSHKFGEQGDFITAPEMGDLFARGLAQSIVSIDAGLGKNLLEIGAGSGQLAADLLSQLEAKNRLPENYFILEPSASLQSLQYQKISAQVPAQVKRVTWLNELPKKFVGIIFANEVVDAIPCDLIEKTASGWQYKGVSNSVRVQAENKKSKSDAGTEEVIPFDWAIAGECNLQELPPILLQQEYPDGYISEVRPMARGWIKGLANALERGHILLFDYGYPQKEYYHPQRTSGSLKCFSRHHANESPLQLVGLQDITAHVDFSHLAVVASDCELEVSGFTTQAGFLLQNKILEAAESQLGSTESCETTAGRMKLSQQIQMLTAPTEMGELIKVICLSRGCAQTPEGFSLQNQLYRL